MRRSSSTRSIPEPAFRALCAALLVCALGASAARGHVVLGRATLRQAVARADAVVVARFETGVLAWQAPDGTDRQDHYRVTPTTSLKGEVPEGPLRFFPHAEGLPGFREGDRSLLFLERSADHGEFAPLAEALPWYSTQGAGDEWHVPDGEIGERLLGIVRGYAGLDSLAPEARAKALRGLLERSLSSRHPPLRVDALNELSRSGASLLRTPADAAPFVALVSDRELPLTERLLLLRALDGTPSLDAETRATLWNGLLAEPAEGAAALARIRAAGAQEGHALSRFVVAQLSDPDPALRREAARALGHPRHAAHAEALGQAARDEDEAVARAAIQALGAQGEPDARRTLETLAASLPEPRSRWARAALRR
ncbi:MAG: HEAT repeat domain-containing protein [Myxococcota bacterium]|nr:HEAT repeat domain-containing protein [Myxococcota bacterium]